MSQVYENEVLEEYKKAFENVVKTSTDQTKNEYLSEFNGEKAKLAEMVMKKYEMLSAEY